MTRAGIGMMMPDGTIWAVNVRGDGYIVGGTGEFLAEECTAREKVEALIFQGEEAPIKVENKESFPDYAYNYFGGEYAYLFENGRWLVCEIHINSHSEWRELTEVLKDA